MRTPAHARGCLIFRNFNFEKRRIENGKPKIYRIRFYTQQLIDDQRRVDRNYLKLHPGEKFLTHPFIKSNNHLQSNLQRTQRSIRLWKWNEIPSGQISIIANSSFELYHKGFFSEFFKMRNRFGRMKIQKMSMRLNCSMFCNISNL